MPTFTAAVVQLSSGTDVATNIEAMEAGIRAAAAQGAQYVQTHAMD